MNCFLDLPSPYLVMHMSFDSPQHNCMVFRHVASVPLKMPGMCQPVLGWSSWEDGGSQSRANVCVCLLCAFITLMAVSFLSLPLSLSLLPMLPLAHTGHAHLSGLSQPKLDFCSCVFSFVCFFFFLFTCLSLLVSLSVPHTPSQMEGPQPSSSQGLTWYPAAARRCSRS